MTAKTSATEVPYSATQMYALVADVARYPEFLPWCVALRVIDRSAERGLEFLTCEMVVAYRVFRERFRSRVTLDPQSFRIEARYLDGPFRTLMNEWRFKDRDDGGSIVHFHIDFEFRSLILQATAQAVFERAFLKMSDAFVERARAVYGGGNRT